MREASKIGVDEEGIGMTTMHSINVTIEDGFLFLRCQKCGVLIYRGRPAKPRWMHQMYAVEWLREYTDSCKLERMRRAI